MPCYCRVGLLLALILALAAVPATAQEPAPPQLPCASPGWKPSKQLKDHSIFTYNGAYYLVSNSIDRPNHWENLFAYARSLDLCTWEDLSPVLAERRPGAWDEMAVWAPFVFVEGGRYYMFYTGVTRKFTQSIMLAISDNPADPAAWRPQGVVFQPSHKGMVWPGWGAWSDARDPHVIKDGNRYYLYYTGQDRDGGIVGVAAARTLYGPWNDLGPTISIADGMPESAGVFAFGGRYYLYYNRTTRGAVPEIRSGPTPTGPWSEPQPLQPGWAHELWVAPDGVWMASYLTDYTVSIRPVIWSTRADVPHPVIGEPPWRFWVPLVQVRAAPTGS